MIPSKFVKYLGILIDEHLNWHAHQTALSTKLSRAIGMLYKIRHFVDHATLRMIYFGIFSSILMYGCQIWGQNNSVTTASPLFKNCKILKLADNINLQNFLFAHDSMKNNLPTSLSGQLSLVDTIQNTRSENYYQLNRPTKRTITYGSKSIKSRSIDIWNFINRLSFQDKLNEKTRPACKKFVTEFLINRY